MTTQTKPIAVLLADIHFTVATLDLATASLQAAMDKAKKLQVPLIVCGDTLDGKALIQAKVANRLIDMFYQYSRATETYVLVGNHDLLNEKDQENALNFLCPLVNVVAHPVDIKGMRLMPYYSDAAELQKELNRTPKGSLLIMHQGVQTAYMGHYMQDKTSLSKETFADFRVISGHYHRAQDIKCGRPRTGAVGLFSYIGNPYTLTFGEANDGPKGFQVLYDNGLMEQVPLDLRRHYVVDLDFKALSSNFPPLWEHDLLWLKVRGTRAELATINKNALGERILGHANFKLELISSDVAPLKRDISAMSTHDVLDSIIDSTDESLEHKAALKALWREVMG